MFIRLSLCLSLLLPTTLFSMRLVILGDSLTAGYGVTKPESYPKILEEELKKISPQHQVIAAGISGSTTASGLYRIKEILKKSDSLPTHVLIALGGNDALRGLPPQQVRYNLENMIQILHKKGISPMLAGMKAPPNQGKDYTQEFDRIYPELSKKFNIPLLPFLLDGVAGQKDLNQSDQIHPNKQGHKVIAMLVLNFLKPHL